jgi:hypothetical protein
MNKILVTSGVGFIDPETRARIDAEVMEHLKQDEDGVNAENQNKIFQFMYWFEHLNKL